MPHRLVFIAGHAKAKSAQMQAPNVRSHHSCESANHTYQALNHLLLDSLKILYLALRALLSEPFKKRVLGFVGTPSPRLAGLLDRRSGCLP